MSPDASRPPCPPLDQLEQFAAGEPLEHATRAHIATCDACRATVARCVENNRLLRGFAQPEVFAAARRFRDAGHLEVAGYDIRSEIHRGGQGIVYEAFQQATQRKVALKTLLRGALATSAQQRRFEREIRLVASLRHPNIVTIHEAGHTAAGQHFFSMELVTGVPLSAYVARPDVSLRERLQLFLKVCEAVHYAHESGVIHRDLKPSNIMVDADGNPKILDFGLACITNADVMRTATATETGRIMGTLAYMSPEQARGAVDEIDARSDVYSLGEILYELLTGHLPHDFSSRPLHEAVRTICEDDPPRPGSIDRRLRGDLETIVLKALAKEPRRRYQSAKELGTDLARHLAGEPIRAMPPGGLYVLRKKLAKHRAGIGLLAVLAALGLMALGFRTWRAQHELAEDRRAVLLIQCDLERGRVDVNVGKARALFERCPDLPEACLVWAQSRVRAARAAGDEARMAEVVFTLRNMLQRDPSQWAFRALLAEIYTITGDRQADALLSRALHDAPDTAEAWYLRSFTTLRDVGLAVQAAENAIRREPDHALAWERLAYLYLQTEDFDGARRAARKLITLGRDPVHWLSYQGRVLTRQHRYSEAIECYSRAVVLAPAQEKTYTDRAATWICLGRYEEAIADYSKVLDLGPESRRGTWTRYRRATPLWMTGRLAEAEADYREVRALLGYAFYTDSRLFLVLRDQARRLRAAGLNSEADRRLAAARTALEDGRAHAAPGSWLAQILACLDGELAPEDLVRGVNARKPEHVCEAYYYAAEACLLSDRVADAITWFQKCVETGLAFDPDSSTLVLINEYHLARWRLARLQDSGAVCAP